MGRPKLLLPLGATTVIDRLLTVLQQPGVCRPVVVLRADDEPLRSAVTQSGGHALPPAVAPADMRQSVERALEYIAHEYQPNPQEGWLLAPADHPLLDAGIVSRLIARWNVGDCRILVPVHNGRRGHPTIFRWDLAAEVFKLPADQGLNQLMRRHAADVCEWEAGDAAVITDLDTPEDYEQLTRVPD